MSSSKRFLKLADSRASQASANVVTGTSVAFAFLVSFPLPLCSSTLGTTMSSLRHTANSRNGKSGLPCRGRIMERGTCSSNR